MSSLTLKIVLAGALLTVFSLWHSSNTSATNTTFTQKILPLNCIFTTINAGTGELYYVTPAACGAVVSVPAQPQPSLVVPNIVKHPLRNQAIPFITKVIPLTSNVKPSTSTSPESPFHWQSIIPITRTNPAKKPLEKAGGFGIFRGVGIILGVIVFLSLVVVMIKLLLKILQRLA